MFCVSGSPPLKSTPHTASPSSPKMAYGANLPRLCHPHFGFSHKLHSSDTPILSGTIRVSTGRITQKDFRTGRTRGGLSNPNVAVTQCPEKAFEANGETEGTPQVSDVNEIKQLTCAIKEKLQSINDGLLSISAYDTAWVALVRDIHGSNAPLFPSSLDWIINNQLSDGSWGFHDFFCAYDRLNCTLACIIALKTWDVYGEGVEKGVSFLRQNLHKLKYEDPEHQLSGFEVTFPTLIQMASKLGLEVIHDSTVLNDLYAKRELKLKRIPMEVLHNQPTTLLYSLEGLPDLEWEKLLKLQHPNGSFLCSTSSTAYALMQTKDEKCFKYLKEIVERFSGGVPHSYPVDLYERLWVVDRLDRLGFSRFFEPEIKECLDYVYRFWTPNGISWSRDTFELDVDDTSMGFRMLRLHGYNVKADAFKHFEREGQFFCFLGQNSQGITEMLSLYRASQLLFPGENILKEAKDFASTFLREKQNLGQVTDRWIITKDLVGEVRYYLDLPWYASLPRIETRYYIDQYGGDDDVWIAKVLHRMYNVSNNLYLELAKLDYNHCQKLHQLEWIYMQRWYEEFNLGDFGFSKDDLLKYYFLAMSSIFEPNRATERVAWAQTAVMIEVVSVYFKRVSNEQKKVFIQAFSTSVGHSNNRGVNSNGTRNGLVEAMLKTLVDISLKVRQVHGEEVDHNLKHVWNAWLLHLKAHDEKHLVPINEAELLVCTINICAGHASSINLIHRQPKYVHLTNLINAICNCLRQTQNFKAGRKSSSMEEMATNLPTESTELDMQELMQCVIKSGDGIDKEIKQTFLTVAKTYYYTAYCEPTTIQLHTKKVLFERVV